MKIEKFDSNFVISDYDNFDIEKTFESGQCFRWTKCADDSYIGIVQDNVFRISKQQNRLMLEILNNSHDIFQTPDGSKFIKDISQYFDLATNYEEINASLLELPFISDACRYSKGIRILRQDPWEMLISYIISQNNNIPRIKKIINRLCENFGKKLCDNFYSFPKAEDLYGVSLHDLQCLNCGFRDKYILDAILKVKEKTVILKDIYDMPTDQARKSLLTIKGVGNKVADCVLLYGFGKKDCFPVDTWIKKAMDKYLKSGLSGVKNEYLGIVQQYIYYYMRSSKFV